MRAHEEGILTSASLMVTGSAFDDAVRRAREHPSLAVGLHLTLAGAAGALAPRQAPRLLDGQGRLPQNPALAGVAYFLNRAVRSELRSEIAAQFERFAETGLDPSHLDGHFLMHLHPTILSMAVPLAEEYGFRGIRFPRDDLRLILGLDRSRAMVKAGWAGVYALLCRLAEQRLKQSSVVYTDRVYGLLQTGHMHEQFVAGLLRRIPAWVGSAEIYFHPSIEDSGEPYGPNPGDLKALLSNHVRQAVTERRAKLTNYAALAVNGHRRMACPGLSSS